MSIFQKILNHEIPADILYEDDRCMAFRDIRPQAPVHVLVIPRKPIPSLNDISSDDEALIGHLYLVIRQLTRELGVAETGYRVVVNCGDDGGQEVEHLHFHLLGGRGLGWPPG